VEPLGLPTALKAPQREPQPGCARFLMDTITEISKHDLFQSHVK
jgi:hypothetical protein